MQAQEVFVSPRIDVVFKAIFGKVGNKALLESLISSVTGIPRESLVDIEIQLSNMKAYTERILYYWAKMYTGSVDH